MRDRAETLVANAQRPGSLSGVLYAEDMPVDRRFDLGSYAVSAEEIKRFAALWDPLPMHLDEDAAAATPFGGLIASGVHTLAIANRLAADAVVSKASLLAGRGVRDMRLLKPVRPATTLTGSLQIIENDLRDNGPRVHRLAHRAGRRRGRHRLLDHHRLHRPPRAERAAPGVSAGPTDLLGLRA